MTGRSTCWFDTEHLIPACKSKTAPWVSSSALERVLRALSFPYLKMRSAEHTLVFFLEPKTHPSPSGAWRCPLKQQYCFFPHKPLD